MPVVKCIKIDSKNKNLNYVDLDIPVSEGYDFHPMGYKEAVGIGGCAKYTLGRSIIVYHEDGSIEDPKKIPNYGFWLWSDMLKKEYVDIKALGYRGSVESIYGDALIVSYAEERKNGRKNGQLVGRAHPIDSTLTLEEASRLVGKYTNGIEDELPDFTCLVSEGFSQPGYEILLRLENEELFPFGLGLSQPIRNLTPQILTFTFCKKEITVMTGKITDLNDKVQVSIFESGRADLRCLASCTLAANKIPGWVNGRLKDYYFNLLVTEPFLEELNGKRSFEAMERELGID